MATQQTARSLIHLGALAAVQGIVAGFAKHFARVARSFFSHTELLSIGWLAGLRALRTADTSSEHGASLVAARVKFAMIKAIQRERYRRRERVPDCAELLVSAFSRRGPTGEMGIGAAPIGMRRSLPEAIATLAKIDQHIVRRHDLEGATMALVAAELGMKESSAWRRRKRAFTALRNELRGDGQRARQRRPMKRSELRSAQIKEAA